MSRFVTLAFGLCLFCLTCIFPEELQASEIIFSEDFSGGFEQWQPVRDDAKPWKIIEGQAEVYLDRPFTITELVPRDEIWNQGWQNLELELDYQPVMGVDKNISFGFQNLQHWYEIHFAEDFFNLVKLKNGSTPFDLIRPFVLSNGPVYRIKIRFQTGHIQVYVNNTLIAEEFDATFDNDFGKIGLKVSTGVVYPTWVRFDNITVRQIDSSPSLIPLTTFKQNDPRWAATEYDSATRWSSNPTISRWGCALTSMVMILQYYGVSTLPSGEVVTPLTLNAWLLAQPDGYIGDGLVNWLAITRLSKLVSQIKQTPALEFSIHKDQLYETAIQELTQHRPVIFQIPGHFLVANGWLPDLTDFSIIDPLYSYPHFTDHRQPLQSLRTFMPSHTDLSYLLIAHPPSVSVTLVSESYPSAEVVTIEESLEQDSEQTSATTLHYIPTPESGTWQLKATATSPAQLTILAYDVAGNPTDLSLPRFNGAAEFTINYQKQAISQIKGLSTFSNLRLTLEQLRSSHGLYRHHTFLTLNQIAWWADKSHGEDQLRYLTLFSHHLTLLAPTMSSEAYHTLDDILEGIRGQLSGLPP